MRRNYIIGIDIGGTNIKAGLLKDSKLILTRAMPTARGIKKGRLIQAILGIIDKLLISAGINTSRIMGIGVGMPGPINSKRGIVRYLPNIKGWHNVHLRKILRAKLKIPVFLDNDANLMLLAEGKIGSAKNLKNVIGLTLGTGVGGGILIDGRLYRGSSFVAGEAGHIPINEKGPLCNCKGEACLERYIGNKYIIEKARQSFGKGISLEELSGLARKGNPRAIKIWKDAAVKLGIALSGLVNFFNPEAVVIGGGVANAGEIFFKAVRETVKKRAMADSSKAVKILKAKTANNAGILGAAILVKEELLLKSKKT